jgi:small subunit ribosomal protein S5
MSKKEELEQRIAPDEKEREERKALEGQKVERPIDEKLEGEVEQVVEEGVEGLKEEDIEKKVEEAEEKESGHEGEEEKEKEKKMEGTSEETPAEEKKEQVVQPSTAPIVTPSSEVDPDFPFWKPKTMLGKEVSGGTITNIDQILQSGRKILEPEITDRLVPGLQSELILIGGRKGKGGGKQRIPVRITATMHRSGRKFKSNAFGVVGDENGLIGIAKASSRESREAIKKAINKAKINVIRIKRGCGSWECSCGEDHSIPYRTEGKSGSVRVVLIPAPRGLGLAADDESKKVLRLAGIKDVWMKTYGNTGMRINLVTALFKALKNLYIYDR